MDVLIIGGTGVISRAITRFLVARGHAVTVYNRGNREAQIPQEVKRLYGDRTEYATFEAKMRQAGPFDCVIDMVCFEPADAESACRAFRGRTKQYIFCSTVDVYTKPAACYPIVEDEEREPSPSFPYAYKKAKCERIFSRAHEEGDFAVTTIRPAHTYGPGGRILHTMGFETYFLDRLRRGQPIVVHGDGSSLWSSCHRDDVARAFVRAVGNEDAVGRAYHVTGEEWMTWNRYYRGIAQAMDAPEPTLVHIPTDLLVRALPQKAKWCAENFRFNNIFDNSAAREDLAFSYTIPWVEGVRATVAWLEEHERIERSETYPFYDRLIAAWRRLGEGMTRHIRA